MIDPSVSAPLVRQLLVVPLLVLGVSHVVQPGMWREFFTRLHSEGAPGVVTRTFTLELWMAIVLVTFHQVWSGPEIAITIYGNLLMTKITLSMLEPSIGLRSLSMAESKGDMGFRVAGVVLCGLAGLCVATTWGGA